MIRSSMRYVSYVDRKPIARDLRKVYSAANAEEAERQLELFDKRWGEKYPMIAPDLNRSVHHPDDAWLSGAIA